MPSRAVLRLREGKLLAHSGVVCEQEQNQTQKCGWRVPAAPSLPFSVLPPDLARRGSDPSPMMEGQGTAQGLAHRAVRALLDLLQRPDPPFSSAATGRVDTLQGAEL